MSKPPWYFDCPQCGEMGRVETLRDHPTRPMLEDLGFCPHCGAEQNDVFSRAQILSELEQYDDTDPVIFVAKLDEEVA